eukprot:TRINITY_DN6784_c0_g1_i1.p1 TRINITY_DN6784_c0_g1~~TRINITY_DN6784_c0_g1_i1.p1  ORF type:complete len:342 (-),score=40.58 TRINITY_DN6784_c0_g1_i1:120-1145(-)
MNSTAPVRMVLTSIFFLLLVEVGVVTCFPNIDNRSDGAEEQSTVLIDSGALLNDVIRQERVLEEMVDREAKREQEGETFSIGPSFASWQKGDEVVQFHNVHIPKAGGSSVVEELSDYVKSCCPNARRRAGKQHCRPKDRIHPFAGHAPLTELFHEDVASTYFHLINLRRPSERTKSGYFYTLDSRPFQQFIHDPHIRNIAVKMLAYNKFPYKAVRRVDEAKYERVLVYLRQMNGIIILEHMAISSALLSSLLPPPPHADHQPSASIPHARDNSANKIDGLDFTGYDELNSFDIRLYDEALRMFCRSIPLEKRFDSSWGTSENWSSLVKDCVHVGVAEGWVR